MKKRIIATTCVGMILMSGVVFAANIDNIKNYFRGLGNGIDSAIENGYVENPEMDYIESNTTLSKETGTVCYRRCKGWCENRKLFNGWFKP